jgi:peptide/nickel transport system permease protein
MLAYIARRTLAIVPVMAVVSLFVFGLLHLTPGDPAAVIAGDQATPADVARIRAALGLDQPLLSQFISWLSRILQGDLGVSVASNVPVSPLIAQRIEPTLSLMAVTTLIAVVIAVPLGVVAAARANSWIDRAIMGVAVFGFSVPVFVVGYALAYIFALELQWLPVQGYTPLSSGLWPWLRQLLLPSAALATFYAALVARMTRAAMIEVLQQDYIRADRAKGMSETKILFVRALKNAAPPIVTVIGAGIGLLIGGAVVSESVFAIPGLGRLTIDSILRRDYPVIQGVVLLFSVSYVLINLAIDIAYAAFDPRIRYR